MKEKTAEKSKEETEEETLNKNLQDKKFVNYNLLTKLEEIKRINYSILEILNKFYQKSISEESKEEKEGVFKPK